MEGKNINYELSDQFAFFTKSGTYTLEKDFSFTIGINSYSLGNLPVLASLEKRR